MCPGDQGGELELRLSTNNDAVIVSVVVVDPDGGLFGGEVSTFSKGDTLKSIYSRHFSRRVQRTSRVVQLTTISSSEV